MNRSTNFVFRKFTQISRRRFFTGLAVTLLLSLVGCDKNTDDLRLQDLTPAELLYVERIIVLERAKAIALVDRETGNAVLDSLAAAWGENSLAATKAGSPRAPERSAQVNLLLKNILTAERDSLLATSGTDYLSAPITDPPPPAPPVIPEPKKSDR